MPTVNIISKGSGTLIENTTSNTLILKENSVVVVNISIEEVANFKREGDTAVITLKNGEKIIIESYFDDPVNSHQIIFDDGSQLYWAEFTDATNNIAATIKYHPIESVEVLFA